jgi:hypothetical protein
VGPGIAEGWRASIRDWSPLDLVEDMSLGLKSLFYKVYQDYYYSKSYMDEMTKCGV